MKINFLIILLFSFNLVLFGEDINFPWIKFLYGRALNLPYEYSRNGKYGNQNVAVGDDKLMIYRNEYNESLNISNNYYDVVNLDNYKLDNNHFKHYSVFEEDIIVILGERNIILYNLTNKYYSNIDPSKDVINIPNIKAIEGKTYDLHDLVIYREGIDIITDNFLIDKNIEYNKRDTYYYWSDNDSYVNFINQKIPLAIRNNSGINESFILKIKQPQLVYQNNGSHIYILNGYVDLNRMYLYEWNNRVKTLDVYNAITNEFIETINFNDSVYFEKIKVPKGCTELKCIIKDIYKGSKYDDTCITAVVYGKYNKISVRDKELKEYWNFKKFEKK